MASQKDYDLVRFLTSATKAGNVQWEASAIEGAYFASFKGKYNVSMESSRDRDGDMLYSMILRNAPDNREMLRLSEYQGLVVELFEVAQRAALSVDAAIDDIMDIPPDDLSKV